MAVLKQPCPNIDKETVTTAYHRRYQLALHVCVTAGGEARWGAAGVAPLASLIRQPARGLLHAAEH